MTLNEFLIKNNRADLNVNDSMTNHIRQCVQNIDALASRALSDIPREDIRDIYAAILHEYHPHTPFFLDKPWIMFERDARRSGITEEEIQHIGNHIR